eukprot:m.134625 g.134625  ORF g.134625 m.134625 type:complete len:302 (-) comp16920_c0_seq1:86-991(-)
MPMISSSMAAMSTSSVSTSSASTSCMSTSLAAEAAATSSSLSAVSSSTTAASSSSTTCCCWCSAAACSSPTNSTSLAKKLSRRSLRTALRPAVSRPSCSRVARSCVTVMPSISSVSTCTSTLSCSSSSSRSLSAEASAMIESLRGFGTTGSLGSTAGGDGSRAMRRRCWSSALSPEVDKSRTCSSALSSATVIALMSSVSGSGSRGLSCLREVMSISKLRRRVVRPLLGASLVADCCGGVGTCSSSGTPRLLRLDRTLVSTCMGDDSSRTMWMVLAVDGVKICRHMKPSKAVPTSVSSSEQ